MKIKDKILNREDNISGVIVITPEKFYDGEEHLIEHITSRGSIIHLRKPNSDLEELKLYCERVATISNYPQNISIHYNPHIAEMFNFGGVHIRYNQISELKNHNFNSNIRLSCSTHSFTEALDMEKLQFSYYFLSPIFDSISKKGYRSNYSLSDIDLFLKRAKKCVALGGINSENIEKLTNFYSVALLGAVWVIEDEKLNVDSSIERFEKIDGLWKELKNYNI